MTVSCFALSNESQVTASAFDLKPQPHQDEHRLLPVELIDLAVCKMSLSYFSQPDRFLSRLSYHCLHDCSSKAGAPHLGLTISHQDNLSSSVFGLVSRSTHTPDINILGTYDMLFGLDDSAHVVPLS